MKIREGLFITFEGGEGSGKSVQSKNLRDFLENQGFDVVLTREPGGTVGAEEIRKIVLEGDIDRWDPKTEALLYLASRSDHWYKKIKPSLDKEKIVICDRFHDSNVVYQGICKGVDINILNSIVQYITDGRIPDRTYLILVNPQIGIARSLSRVGNTEIRLENMDMEFHQKVNDGFLKLSKESPERFLVIDGNQTISEISRIIEEDVLRILDRKRLECRIN